MSVTINTATYKGEEFNIVGERDLSNLRHYADRLEAQGFEPKAYELERILTGRKRKNMLIVCRKSVKTGKFYPLF